MSTLKFPVVWSQIYSDWSQIDLPFPTPAFHNPALMLHSKRFISDSATDYLNDQVEILRLLPKKNFLMHNGAFKNINYYNVSRTLDLHAFDNYPTFNNSPRYSTGAALTLVRGFNGRMMIMEQLRPDPAPARPTCCARRNRAKHVFGRCRPLHKVRMGCCTFAGVPALRGAEEYWYGVLDHDNVPRARFEEFKQEGLELQKIGPQIVGAKVVSEIAVIKDFEDEWVFDYQFLTEEINVGAAYDAFCSGQRQNQRHNIRFPVGPNAGRSQLQTGFSSPNLH